MLETANWRRLPGGGRFTVPRWATGRWFKNIACIGFPICLLLVILSRQSRAPSRVIGAEFEALDEVALERARLAVDEIHGDINENTMAISDEHPKITFVDTLDPTLYSVDYSESHPFENQCRFPVLHRNEPELMKEVEHFVDAECPASEYHTLVEQFPNGELLVGRRYLANITKDFNCFAQELSGTLRPRRRVLAFVGQFVRLPIGERIFVEKDNFHVRCLDSNNTIVFADAFANVPRKARLTPPKLDGTLNVSVSILVLDSLSRNQFYRHAPRLMRFMKDEGFYIMHGYDKVADNSAVNILPLLSGMQVELEVNDPENLLRPEQNLTKDMIKDDMLKHANLLFQLLQKRGCATMMNDDLYDMILGVFNYHHFKGFWKPIADYFFRPYYQYIYQLQNRTKGCTLGRLYNKRMIQSWERFASVYSRECHFGFSFVTALTHDDSNNMELLDETIYDSLLRMKYKGVFDNTVLIIMGDHGQRTSDIQLTYSGRIEERMPMFGMYLPKKLRDAFPDHVKQLVINKNRLISNYDIHETLRELFFLTSAERKPVGRSLFHEIPKNRDCKDAKIPEHHCVCQLKMDSETITPGLQEQIFAQFSDYIVGATRQMPCVDRFEVIRPKIFNPYTIHEKVRNGARDLVLWEQIINGSYIPRDRNEIYDVEYDSEAVVTPKAIDGFQPKDIHLTLRSRTIWHRGTGYTRLIAKPYVLRGTKCEGIRIIDNLCGCLRKLQATSRAALDT